MCPEDPDLVAETGHKCHDKILRRQERDREGVWVGAGGALASSTSFAFLLEPPGVSGSIIPVYCTLLPTVVLGLLAYMAFKWWSGHCPVAPPFLDYNRFYLEGGSRLADPLLPTAGAHISKDSSWPKLELQSWEGSTTTRRMGIAVSSWTLLAVWSPVPPQPG
ncbi:LOW QUALITY PROTEIN: Death domain-containing membrane protein NRADD [Plecturocebus cupreus]